MSGVITDLTPYLDTEIAPLFEKLPVVDYATVTDWEAARAIRRVEPQEDSETVAINNVYVPGYPEGEEHSPLARTYTSKSGPSENTLLWIHGGGFIGGHINDNDVICMNFVDTVGCNVVAASYRLAPEHKYPAAPNDCYAALCWIGSGPEVLGGKPKRIAVAGGSAGGCLAAVMALMARDLEGPKLCQQILVFPVLDDRLETHSSQVIDDPRTWSRTKSLFSWQAYLGNDDVEVSPYAAPARATDLTGLPAASIFVEEMDLLRDEAVEFATRLTRSNVRTGLTVYPGTHHGHTGLAPKSRVSLQTGRDILAAIENAFAVTA